MNVRDGMAYPGRRALAQSTSYYDHEWIERNYTEAGVSKTISELIDFGYLAVTRRAPEGGKRALSHYGIVRRTNEELQAEISTYIEDIRRNGPRRVPEFQKNTADLTPVGNVTPEGNVTPVGNVSGSVLTPVVSAVLTPVVPTVTCNEQEDSHLANLTKKEKARSEAREAFEEYVAAAKRCGLVVPPKPDPWLPNINARLKEHGRDGWRDMLNRVEQSSFLCGRSGDWRGADLDWLCKPKNFAKVLSGKYGNGGGPHPTGPGNASPEEWARQEAEKLAAEETWRRLADEEDAECGR